MKRPLCWAARRWTWGVPVVVASVLCLVPLFDVLSYEFCWAMGLVTAITAPIQGYAAARQTPPGAPVGALFAALRAAVGHALIPLGLICANAWRVQNCNWWQGFGFWLLLPLSTAVYGAVVGLAVGRIGLGLASLTRWTLLSLTIVAPLLCSLWRLYSEPPIFAFDHLWGYFAGSLYDESVYVDARLVGFRLGTALRAVGIASAVVLWELRARWGVARAVFTGLLCAGLPVAYESILGPALGFGIDRRAILAHLPVVVRRPGLEIHLPEGTSQTTQARLADDHAYRLDALRQRLQLKNLPVLHSYVYADAADKARWMGGRNTMVAKPWLSEIYIHDVVAPHAVMPHEMAHVVAASFGSRWLGVSAAYELGVHMGLVEGLAQALSPDDGSLDLHHWAHALVELGLAPAMQEILGPGGFWTQAPPRAYTVAGSFVRYLLETRGPAFLKLAYKNADFVLAYKQPLDALVREWQMFIARLETTVQDHHIAADRFISPSIFRRVCAHEIARLEQLAREAPPRRAVVLRTQIAAHLGWSAPARAALAQAKLQSGDFGGFLGDIEALRGDEGLSINAKARLETAASDLLWQTGHKQQALDGATRVLALQAGEAQSRLAWVQLFAMSQNTADSAPLMAYLAGSMPPDAALAYLKQAYKTHPSCPTRAYLLGRHLSVVQDFAQATGPLKEAQHHPFVLIAEEASRLYAASLCRLEQTDEAQAVWQHLADSSQRSGIVAQAQDALGRLAWSRHQLSLPHEQ